MEAFDILKAFGEYTGYDPGQTVFNLLSNNYVYHNAGKVITTICDNYDPTGRMAVLYAKKIYDNVIRESRVKMYDLLTHHEEYLRERQMFDIFNGEDVRRIEKEYMDALNAMITRVTGMKEIGERDLDKERETLYSAIEDVAEQLGRCYEDVYISGDRPVETVTNVSKKILLFNYMADCVLALQNGAPDGAYFCYINNNGTADGYFAIVIKSNGNLFSVNDRVPEAYIGQHTRSRNNRWAEGHMDIFPYNQVLSFSDYDYLGYAQSYSIDESKLEFRDLDASAYIPVILAILCVMNSRAGKMLDPEKQVYMNTLIRSNIENTEEGSALIRLDNTGLIDRTTEALRITFDKEKFLRGGYREEFGHKDRDWNQPFVDMYASDFTPSVKTLSLSAKNSLMSGEENQEIHAEFIGNMEAMRRQAYYESRIELAEHIRKNMKKELEAAGGLQGLCEWFEAEMRENMPNLLPYIAHVYSNYEKKTKGKFSMSGVAYGYHDENDPDWVRRINVLDYEPSCWNKLIYNEPHKEHLYGDRYNITHFICPISGKKANIWFRFNARTTEDIEHFTGCEVPKILKGWRSESEYGFYGGNRILDTVDEVDFVKPFDSLDHNRSISFDYYIGLSKLGINRILKESGEKG